MSLLQPILIFQQKGFLVKWTNKITVIKNWLDPHLIDYLSFIALFKIPHSFHETSNKHKVLSYTRAKNIFYSKDFCSTKHPHAEYNSLIEVKPYEENLMRTYYLIRDIWNDKQILELKSFVEEQIEERKGAA